MVHGIFGNLAQFYMTIAPKLSRDFRIVLYDLRSHGKSTCHDIGYDLQSLSNDIKYLLDALNIDKCHLVGFSFGSLIVLKFGMLFKDRVKKIVLLDVPPKFMFPMKQRGAFGFNDFLDFTSELPPLMRKTFMRNKRQIEHNYTKYEYIVNQTSFIQDVKQDGEFSAEDYRIINVPMKLIFGRQSDALYEFNRIRGWIKNSEISFIDGDHYFFAENPDETSEVIRDFFNNPATF
jgi:pimeloyl-ACP methyl ester carboxylesterase